MKSVLNRDVSELAKGISSAVRISMFKEVKLLSFLDTELKTLSFLDKNLI